MRKKKTSRKKISNLCNRFIPSKISQEYISIPVSYLDFKIIENFYFLIFEKLS